MALDLSPLLVFDLDGLIIDSLDNLSRAMTATAASVLSSDSHMREFEEEDNKHPGRSRFEKLSFAMDLASVPIPERELVMSDLLSRFDELSLEARLQSRLDDSIFDFIGPSVSNLNLTLLTNCDVTQLPLIAKHHKLDKVFGDNLFGTPPSKSIVFPQIVHKHSPSNPIFSISDSESDYQIAEANGAEFVLIRRFARDLTFNSKFTGISFDTISDFHDWLASDL